MKAANKARLSYFLATLISIFFVGLAVTYGGGYLGVAFIIAPISLLIPWIYTGTIICPKCGKNIMGPTPNSKNMNPSYSVILFGKCNSCGE
jgi:hypothetical protein